MAIGRFYDLGDERGLLRFSISMTILVATLGILLGVLSGSFSIMFDGIYSLLDVVMSLMSLMVAKLIIADTNAGNLPEKLRQRFSMGFWHLEPIVLGVNGILLISVATYALINAISSALDGGTDLHLGAAIGYAAVTLVICVAMAVVEVVANRRVGSALVSLDIQGWIMASGITGALLAAFSIAWMIEGTQWNWMVPYIDPIILGVVCIVLIPLPLKTVRDALSEILLVTPADLRDHVAAVSADFVERHGFDGFRSYVSKVGRSRNITVYVIVPEAEATKPLAEWDALREELGEAIGGKGPDRWLTITFTSDIIWAE
ncbi:cation diffusion facilitator family transporter [Falsirhodobacter deserti]|uniref:cation diffusion facilitator family transporter n=1 Tax=Falsirhodobacter deserti TaxID=1365611 RepID=UPI000FE3A0A1|nr:cation transporter [Falsirhodobacter deserti]